MAHYRELSPMLNSIIGERFLRNPALLKLLCCYEPECDGTCPACKELEENPNSAFMTHVYPIQKIPDAKTDKGCYLCAYFNGGYEVDENTGYRNVVLNVDIICHLNVWFTDTGYRVYDIMAEVDSMLNNQLTDLPIIGKPYLRGFQTRVYSDYFHGVQLIYNLQVNSVIECNYVPLPVQVAKGMIYGSEDDE